MTQSLPWFVASGKKIIGIGRNFAEHAKELARSCGIDYVTLVKIIVKKSCSESISPCVFFMWLSGKCDSFQAYDVLETDDVLHRGGAKHKNTQRLFRITSRSRIRWEAGLG